MRLHVVQSPPATSWPTLSHVDLVGSAAQKLDHAWWHLPHPAAGPRPLRCPAQRARDRLARFLGYLWDAAVHLPDQSLLQQDTRPGRHGITAYPRLDADGVGHHLAVMGRLPPGHVRDLAQVRLVSGMCLFGSRAAQLVLTSGRRLPISQLRHEPLTERATGLALEPDLTVYEHDTSLRLACAAASLGVRVPAHTETLHALDVPRTATMLMLLDDAQQGMVPAAVLVRWCQAVTDRHARLRPIARQRWQAAWAATGSASPLLLVDVDELQAVETVLRRALAVGRIPNTPELISAAAGQDRLWQQLVALTRPTTATDLADLSYIASYLRGGAGPTLTLGVETVQEGKILLRARHLRHLLADCPAPPPHLAAVYALGRLWTREAEGALQHNLYTHDVARHAVDADGRNRPLAEVCADIYPAAAGRELAVSR
ncbi:hypothetical protein AB0L44_14845 [Nonomuraea wenchangensis]|uniref:hypothetical protein n=1 Tax=Nonomuraea wenchangensis TaxID=568860 RepID=UPI003448C393